MGSNPINEREQDQPIFGQLIVGPPGSGKTTYCKTMAGYLERLGRRPLIINLDPANDVSLPYEPALDVSDLITVEDTMEKLGLGPNGGLIYCMEYLDTNCDWLVEQLKRLARDEAQVVAVSEEAEEGQAVAEAGAEPEEAAKRPPYLLIDCPGQIELYTHHAALKSVVSKLTNKKVYGIDLRLTAVYLVDSHYANDPAKYVSALLNSLAAMVHLELPHVNVLSKVDIMEKYGTNKFGLNFYCEVLDLNYLVDELVDDPFLAKYKEMTKALAGLVEDYSLVSFVPLNINDARTVINVLRLIDKSNGFYFSDIETEDQMERLCKKVDAVNFEYTNEAKSEQFF